MKHVLLSTFIAILLLQGARCVPQGAAADAAGKRSIEISEMLFQSASSKDIPSWPGFGESDASSPSTDSVYINTPKPDLHTYDLKHLSSSSIHNYRHEDPSNILDLVEFETQQQEEASHAN